jgi:amino acid transporter
MAEPPVYSITSEWYKFDERGPGLTDNPIHNSIIALVGTVFIVLSLGEIASIYPTAGGMLAQSRLSCPFWSNSISFS